jgi:hypothetical protein
MSLDRTPLAAEGPPRPPPHAHADPFRALDDLMATVEIFCKRWPERTVHRPPFQRVLL